MPLMLEGKYKLPADDDQQMQLVVPIQFAVRYHTNYGAYLCPC